MGEKDLIKDVGDLKEILGVVTEKVPAIVRGLRDVLYSKEAAESMADAVATFYTKLIDAGLSRDDAMDMTRGYMINLRDVFGGRQGFNLNVGSSDDGRRDD